MGSEAVPSASVPKANGGVKSSTERRPGQLRPISSAFTPRTDAD